MKLMKIRENEERSGRVSKQINFEVDIKKNTYNDTGDC